MGKALEGAGTQTVSYLGGSERRRERMRSLGRMPTTTARRVGLSSSARPRGESSSHTHRHRSNKSNNNVIQKRSRKQQQPGVGVVLRAQAEAKEATSSASLSFDDALSPPLRIGHGFDLHRLEPGYK